MSEPAISIVLPTFNRRELLAPALDSVAAQTWRDFELIVADDGSDAPTREWLAARAREQAFTLLLLEHRGNPAAARNAALAVARGRYVAFLDSDDSWLPQKLARQLAALQASGRRWSYTAISRITATGAPLPGDDARGWAIHEGAIFAPLLRQEVGLALPTVLAERALIAEAGGFDEQLRVHEDFDLWLRLALRADVAVVREALTQVRCHDRHFSVVGAESIEGWDRVLEKYETTLDDARARTEVRRARAATAVKLARYRARSGEAGAMLRALGSGWRRGWSQPRWWLGAMLAVMRLATPRAIGRPAALRR
jgi:glycosyltransferase involved in cell wall biosynthesis